MSTKIQLIINKEDESPRGGVLALAPKRKYVGVVSPVGMIVGTVLLHYLFSLAIAVVARLFVHLVLSSVLSGCLYRILYYRLFVGADYGSHDLQ